MKYFSGNLDDCYTDVFLRKAAIPQIKLHNRSYVVNARGFVVSVPAAYLTVDARPHGGGLVFGACFYRPPK